MIYQDYVSLIGYYHACSMKKLKKPDLMYEAAQTGRGHHWALEILNFFVVLIVVVVLQSIVSAPITIVRLLSNREFMDAALSQDTQKVMELSQSISTSDIMGVITLFLEATMILVAILFCKLIEKRKPSTMGYRKNGMVKEYLIGLLAGFVTFSAAVGICAVTGAIHIEGIAATFSFGMLFLYFIGFMIQGMAEEALCRGYFMVSISRRYPVVVAIMINSIVFAMLHLLNSGISFLAFINLILYGILASLYFIKRGNIWGVAAFHSIWNFVQGNFYGIKVSGMDTGTSVFASSTEAGKAIINGGAFGLEGGLGVTIVLVIGIVMIYLMKEKASEYTWEEQHPVDIQEISVQEN